MAGIRIKLKLVLILTFISAIICAFSAFSANEKEVKKDTEVKADSKQGPAINPSAAEKKEPSVNPAAAAKQGSDEKQATAVKEESPAKQEPAAVQGSGETHAIAVDFLKKLEEKNKEVKTVVGEFSQIKKQELFLEEIKSEGKFYFIKPGKFRCDYLAPNEMTNLLLDNTAYIYVPENKQVDQYTFNKEGSKIKQLNQMLLGFGVSVKDIDDVFNYDIDKTLAENDKQIVITLQPKSKDHGVGISRVNIWFDKTEIKPVKFVSYEYSGDQTIIELKSLKYNTEISEKLFLPEFPADVDIIKQN